MGIATRRITESQSCSEAAAAVEIAKAAALKAMGIAPPTIAMEVAAYIKGQQRYIVIYEPQRRREALRVIGRWASDAELDFTWADAATLCQRIRNGQPDKIDGLTEGKL